MRIVLTILALVLYGHASGAEPTRYTVTNKVPKYTVVNKVPADVAVMPNPAPAVQPAPGVRAAQPFRGLPYNPSHQCAVCGRSAYVISGYVSGGHVHTCAAGHSWWHR